MGSHKLIQVVFFVSLIVVIVLAITFALLFFLYSLYKRKHIKYGHEDENILKELKKKYHIKDDDKETKIVDCINKEEKKSNILWYVEKITSGILLVLLMLVIGFLFTYQVNNNVFFVGNSGCLVIQTGSMEEVYEGNVYIKDNNLTNQIEQFSMIGVDKVNAKDIALYDVVAFKNTNGDIIVHRVVNITNNNGQYLFTLKGDANTASNVWETAVKESQIIGRYNGFQNYGLGLATTYLKSNSGVLALISATIFIITFEGSEEYIDREYKQRRLYVAKQYDEGKE